MKNIHLTSFVSIILILALIFPIAVQATEISGINIDDAVDIIRRELNQDRAELKKDLESIGYEVSETNLDRYIEEFLIEYRKAVIYLQTNQERIYAELQKEIDAGSGQHQIDIVHDRMVEALFKEAGFNPEAIAAKIFPKRKTDIPSAPDPDTRPETQPDKKKEDIQTPVPVPDTVPAETPVPETPAREEEEKTEKQPDPDTELEMKKLLERVQRGGLYHRDFSEEGLLEALTESKPETQYGDRFESVIMESQPLTLVQAMIMPKDRRYHYSQWDEAVEQKEKGLLARTIDVVSTPVGAFVGFWTDWFDNVRHGDGIIEAAGKSLFGNTLYGVGGTVMSGIDLVSYAFTPLDKVGDDDYGPQEYIKGRTNLFWDSVIRSKEISTIEQRAAEGHYRQAQVSGESIEQHRRNIRDDYKIRQFQSDFY